MKRETIWHLMVLVAYEMYRYGMKDNYPRWALRKDCGAEDVVHDERDNELRTLKSERALLVFDEIAAGHRCGRGGIRTCRHFGHESFVAWPELRRMLAAADWPA